MTFEIRNPSDTIRYRAGYKYQTVVDFDVETDIRPKETISTRFITLSTTGWLTVWAGYAWDGPSGPTIDTPNFMRGSLVHDAIYQLMRDGYLPIDHRKQADKLLVRLCRADGMSAIRAAWVYLAVRWFGEPSADPKHKHADIVAP